MEHEPVATVCTSDGDHEEEFIGCALQPCKKFRLVMKEGNSGERRADLWIDVTEACQLQGVFAKHRHQNFGLAGTSPDYDPPASSGHIPRMLDELAFLTLAGHGVTRPAEAAIDGT
jgi:hypothetical protein